LIFYDYETGSIHQWLYGGQDTTWWDAGAYWCDLTRNTITVKRYSSPAWAYVRVMIWKIPE